MQQNSRCWLCGERDKMMNNIISECSKLVQKEYKTRHDWMGKVTHWELYKKLKFDHTNKWYMHNLESIKRMRHTKSLEMTRTYNNQQQKKENLQNCGLCCPSRTQGEIERM